jgi:hypothetical protein
MNLACPLRELQTGVERRIQTGVPDGNSQAVTPAEQRRHRTPIWIQRRDAMLMNIPAPLWAYSGAFIIGRQVLPPNRPDVEEQCLQLPSSQTDAAGRPMQPCRSYQHRPGRKS